MIDRMQNMLRVADKESKYYRRLFEDKKFFINNDGWESDFDKLPVLSRSQLISERDIILCDKYKYMNRKNLIYERTSGSTGHYVDVYWDPKDFLLSTKCLWKKRKAWYGISATDKYCTFFTASNSSERVQTERNVMLFSSHYMSDENLDEYYKNMKAFEPKWLMLTPSMAMILLEFCQKRKLRLPESIIYIELFGENVSDTVYELIKNTFERATSVMYGAKEVNGIALSCPNGKLHVLDDNVYVENYNGKLLLTSLCNLAFPIVRYDIGDLAEMRETECTCGGSKQEIVNLLGKEQFLYYMDGNSGVTSIVIKDALTHIDQEMGYPFLQSQIEYGSKRTTIHLYCKKEFKGWREQIKKEILERLQTYSSEKLSFDISFHDEPIRINAKTGKLPLIKVAYEAERRQNDNQTD